MTCLTCIFWKALSGGDGECKRHAPQVELRGEGRFPHPYWPIVASTEWCGEHPARKAA